MPTADQPRLEAHLERALRFRSEVYQAQGRVAVQVGVGLIDALALVRARGFATAQDLTNLALKHAR